ncbi:MULTISPECIES: hypothetical protein [Streptomyces]|uniref:Lipoprotein n=1 Tax=Streptomyces bangladeshensis TaxID=295352 RepID=A0ABP5NTS6_9ACTN|nr:hypothetical protein [Streptomyces sp. FBKL.4005]OYP15738.1 hypothetical protein CFC35_15520 [Streptomyces sp. FBKL.4005]
MKIKLGVLAVAVPLALTTLTGCSMTDKESDDVTYAGTSTSSDAADALEKISSGIYDLIGVKGKTSDSRATVTECAGKDPDTYFRVLHPWSFTPASPDDLEVAMQRLKEALPKHGWKIVEYGPDNSKNKNLRLTADNDAKKASAHIIQMAKDNPPMLSVDVISGCYQVPEGQKVEHF